VLNKKLTTLLVFVLTTIFYIYTLIPSLAWGDGTHLQGDGITGESFILAEMTRGEFNPDPYLFAKVGVAAWDHPLYIMIGYVLVKTLPFVDSLWLVNLLSAIFGAASVVLVFLICYRFTESILASCYASFSLAVSHTFWWHSSTPEVYTLFVFLLLASIYFFDRYERTGQYSFLGFSAFFLGLAASNHLLAFLAIPALVLYYLLPKNYREYSISDLRTLSSPLLGFLAGFMIYVIQFARLSRNIPINEIMGPVVGSTFLSQLLNLTPALLGESLLTYLLFLIIQFGPVGLILGVLGINQVFRSSDLYVRKLIAFYIVYTIFGIFYKVTDQFAFFMTSHVFWAMIMGIGAHYIFSKLSRKMRLVLANVLALTILGTPFFYDALPNLARQAGMSDASMGIPQIGTGIRDGLAYYMNPNKHGDYKAYNFGYQTIERLEPNSVVIAEWYTDTDEYFILRYFTKVKDVRPDVTVFGWSTQDPFTFDPQLVLQVIYKAFPTRPIYLASLSDRFYASSKLIDMYCIIPENNLYRLYSKENSGLLCLKNNSITE
jgi:Protein O-mannosyl-transferase TMEM260-like